jgi:hypothetical protein
VCDNLKARKQKIPTNRSFRSLHYTIKVSKDHAQVTAKWDISVDMSDTELISSFSLTVEGKAFNTQCSSGNKACKAL